MEEYIIVFYDIIHELVAERLNGSNLVAYVAKWDTIRISEYLWTQFYKT